MLLRKEHASRNFAQNEWVFLARGSFIVKTKFHCTFPYHILIIVKEIHPWHVSNSVVSHILPVKIVLHFFPKMKGKLLWIFSFVVWFIIKCHLIKTDVYKPEKIKCRAEKQSILAHAPFLNEQWEMWLGKAYYINSLVALARVFPHVGNQFSHSYQGVNDSCRAFSAVHCCTSFLQNALSSPPSSSLQVFRRNS